MNGWIKQFKDGSIESGTDEAVQARTASWSRGRLGGMIGASLSNDGLHIAITGDGEFWQSDDYEVPLFSSSGHCVRRRLQKRLTQWDQTLSILETPHSLMVRVLDSRYNGSEAVISPRLEKVPADCVDYWLTTEINTEDRTICWYFSKDRI